MSERSERMKDAGGYFFVIAIAIIGGLLALCAVGAVIFRLLNM